MPFRFMTSIDTENTSPTSVPGLQAHVGTLKPPPPPPQSCAVAPPPGGGVSGAYGERKRFATSSLKARSGMASLLMGEPTSSSCAYVCAGLGQDRDQAWTHHRTTIERERARVGTLVKPISEQKGSLM